MPVYTNTASMTYNGATINSNAVQSEVTDVLSINKTASETSYRQGENVTYIVSILNSGTTGYTGLTVTDNMGAYTQDTATLYPLTYSDGSLLYYVNGTLQPTPTVTYANNVLTVGDISVPAGGNALIVYTARANGAAPPAAGNTIVNTATLTGAGVAAPATAEASLLAADTPDLSITKSVSPLTVTENGQLTFTFTIQNFGNTEAGSASPIVVNDDITPILSNVSVEYNGTPWTVNTNYTYSPANGAFATLPGQVSVPAATYQLDPQTGEYVTTPGVATITVTGTV